MGAALKVSDTIEREVAESGRRVASSYAATVGSDIKRIFAEAQVYQQWEINAIAEAIVKCLREYDTIRAEPLYSELHSRGLSKDLARSLSEALSDKR